MKPLIFAAAALVALLLPAQAGFVENFQGKLALDQKAQHGWATISGSGDIAVKLFQKNGHGVMEVDGRRDRRNIYWGIVKREVTPDIDTAKLLGGGTALRVEARVRISDAPRRIHIQLNTNRTTDYDANLREYDLPDTGWHVISWTRPLLGAGTVDDMDVKAGDHVSVTFGMTDMGRAVYRTEFEYVKVDVIPWPAAPDLGPPLVYRPPLPPIESYGETVPVLQDAVIDAAYPWVNYSAWSNVTDGEGSQGGVVLSVSGSQTIILRFDLSKYRGKTPNGWGVLELTTDHVDWAPTNQEEFGMLRAVEIKSGDPAWERTSVTADSFFQGKPELEVLNGQMFVDAPPAFHRGERTILRINPAVLKRLISGETKGIAIYPQGAVNASFSSSQAPNPRYRPMLHFNVK
jgi:hypothetical protein